MFGAPITTNNATGMRIAGPNEARRGSNTRRLRPVRAAAAKKTMAAVRVCGSSIHPKIAVLFAFSANCTGR